MPTTPLRSTLRPLLLAAWLALATVAAGAADSADTLLDEVQVVGERPGPAMWKVTRGDHTLWIMGTLSPVPAKMTWKSKQAEEVISRSGEILAPSVAGIRFESTWSALRNLRGFLGLRHNAGGATLREVLPEDIYSRWVIAHRRWFGKDPDPKERARPLYAAALLHDQALEKSGLAERSVVWPVVSRLAEQHKLRIRRREFVTELDAKAVIAELSSLPRDKEAACLVATLDYIDRELPDLKRRAQAWAHGDMAALRALPRVNPRMDCMAEAVEKTRLFEMASTQAGEMREDWSGIVDWMLLTHQTSFAAMPIERLLDENGELARLRAKGYTVEEPQ